MSRTIRRKHLNRKKHFFNYYFSLYTKEQIVEAVQVGLLREWEFFSDNFGSLSNRKQFCATLSHRQKRAEFRQKAQFFLKDNSEEADILIAEKPKDIKWDVT